MSVLAMLYGVLFATQVVFAVVSVALARLVGARVAVLNIGSPAVWKHAIGSQQVHVGPVPGAGLEIADFEKLPLPRRLVIRLGPWIVQLGIAIALLGPSHALRSFANGFYQLLFVWDPRQLAERFMWILQNAPFGTVLGILLAKMVAFNLLPFAGLAGGGVIEDVAYAPRGKRYPPMWMIGSLIFVLVIAGRWAWALLAAV